MRVSEMTVPEQAGKVATSAIDAFKTNPSCLAAILLAALFAFLTYIGLQREAERSQKRLEGVVGILNRCLDNEHDDERSRDELQGLVPALLQHRVRGL